MARPPSEHQSEAVSPDARPVVFEYSELTKPGSPERIDLEAKVAELGWSNLFELIPPGVADAYEVIREDLAQLADELGNPPTDSADRLRSLGTYVRTLVHLDEYQEQFGIWWGVPADSRAEMNRVRHELRSQSPLTPNQIERLLERWAETEEESIAQFAGLVEGDCLGLLHPGGIVTESVDGGLASLGRWTAFQNSLVHTGADDCAILIGTRILSDHLARCLQASERSYLNSRQ